MDDVVKFLSGEYGIRQPGKSIPMAASKPSPAATLPSWNNCSSNSGMSSNLSDGVLEEKNALSSSKKDNVLEILGMELTETKGLGFEELVHGNKASDDPFLVFETGYPSWHQSPVHSNVISSASVNESKVFDISGGIGRSNKSSFASEGTKSVGKDSSPSRGQNPVNAQKFIAKEPLQSSSQNSNHNAKASNPPILGENFEFFSIYENTADERERAATVANDDKNNYNGVEAFFSDMGLGISFPPSQIEATSQNVFDSPFEMRGASGRAQGVPVSSNFNIMESSSMKNRMGDLPSGIGAFQSPSEFLDGDNEHRRCARNERERKKIERAAKALSEKIELDFELQREKKEREMFAEELDVEVKQWAAGREGNLRALISTLQGILWPECEWRPISLGNLMTSTAVKKAYGKAVLCIHPDKVQQKGATLQQKYVAEKVFYLLTEALNKFSSEELS